MKRWTPLLSSWGTTPCGGLPRGDLHLQAHGVRIRVDRVIDAVLLGIVTHDANLLLVYPPGLRRLGGKTPVGSGQIACERAAPATPVPFG